MMDLGKLPGLGRPTVFSSPEPKAPGELIV